jgi:hypothetical protein
MGVFMQWTKPNRTVLALVALVALVGVGACDGGVIEDDWPDFRVRGTVTDPIGHAVASAVVWLETLAGPECTESASFTGPYLTGQSGQYAGAFSNGLGYFIGCVEARVTPPASTGLAAVHHRTEVVELDVDGAGGAELALNVVLPVAEPE